mgnify:FL=1
MTDLCLHIAPGACSRVPLIALETIGVPFYTQVMRFMKGEHKSSQFKNLNPSGKIPVLVVNGTPIPQNVAILIWLSKTYPQANLLPESNSSLVQAKVMSALVRFSADLHPLVTRIRMPHFFCDLEGAPQRVVEMATVSISEQLQQIEADLLSQPWMLGDHWSVIDAYLHWVWFRITGAGFDPAPFPAITAHYSRTLEMPAVQRAISRENDAEALLQSEGLMPRF